MAGTAVRRAALALALLGLCLIAAGLSGPVHAAGSQTTDPSLALAATYESISVYLSFKDDDNDNNEAALEYREAGGSWKRGMAMTVDRRATVRNSSKTYPNTFKDQWRASILGLRPGSRYEVRVTLRDPDGVSGTNPVVADISTRVETDQIPSDGRSLYVSPDGDDVSGDGSEARPWRTVQKAADDVQVGDTVNVRPGTYRESLVISRSGAADNYITFSGVAADSVTIAPPGDTTDRETSGIATDASFLRIRGFRIEGGHTGIRVSGRSTNVIVEDNFVVGWSSTGYGIRIGGGLVNPGFSDTVPVESITVQNNTLHATNRQTEDHGGIESSADNRGGHVIRNNRIEFLYVSDGSHGEDCIIHQPNTDYSDSYKDTDIHGNVCIGATDDGIELDGNNVNTRVWDNVITGANVGFSIGPSAVGPTYIFRNVVYDLAYQWTVCVGIKEGRSGSGHVYFYHNTFYLTATGCAAKFPDQSSNERAFAIADAAGDPSSNIVLKNNIFWFAERGFSISDRVPNDLVSDYNLWFDEDGGLFSKYVGSFGSLETLREGTDFEEHGIAGDPSFVGAASANFRLREGSPAVDAGVVILGFNDPLSAWPYSGAAPDIGAFEAAGGPDIAPPSMFDGRPTGTLPSGTLRATLSLSTDEPATCRYSDSADTAFEAMSLTFPDPGATLHEVNTPDLADGESYAYYVRCEDGEGNTSRDSLAISFNVAVADTSPPVMSGVEASVDLASVVIEWRTDDPASSSVSYGTARSSLDRTETSPGLMKRHSITPKGLTPGSTYFFEVRSCNADGLCSSAAGTFVTASTAIFEPVDDAFVWEREPDTSFGSAKTLEVDADDPSGSGQSKWIYLKFEVTGVSGDVTLARITLSNVNESEKGGDLHVVRTSEWGEGTLTWSNKPQRDGSPIGSLDAVSRGDRYSFDVSSVIAGDGTYSFAIAPASNNGADYDSKEGDAAPALEIAFQPDESPTPVAAPSTDEPSAAAWGRLAASFLFRMLSLVPM